MESENPSLGSTQNSSQNSSNDNSFALYVRDIRDLLVGFQKKKSLLFKDFKDEWKRMGFSLIHETKPDSFSSAEYLQTLYITVLGFFFVNKSFSIRVGALYTLYTLYETQHNNPKTKIIVSLAMWQDFIQFMQGEIIPKKVVDAYHIFRKMKKEDFFIYAALPPTIDGVTNANKEGQIEPADIINVETLSGVVDIDSIQKTAGEYLSCMQSPDGSHTLSTGTSFVNLNLVGELKDILTTEQIEKMNASVIRTMGIVGTSMLSRDTESSVSALRNRTYRNKRVDRLSLVAPGHSQDEVITSEETPRRSTKIKPTSGILALSSCDIVAKQQEESEDDMFAEQLEASLQESSRLDGESEEEVELSRKRKGTSSPQPPSPKRRAMGEEFPASIIPLIQIIDEPITNEPKYVKSQIEKEVEDDIKCATCGGGDFAPELVLCDGCDVAYHLFCMVPKLNVLPKGQFFCSECKKAGKHKRRKWDQPPVTKKALMDIGAGARLYLSCHDFDVDGSILSDSVRDFEDYYRGISEPTPVTSPPTMTVDTSLSTPRETPSRPLPDSELTPQMARIRRNVNEMTRIVTLPPEPHGDTTCVKCRSAQYTDKLITCETCHDSYHSFCLHLSRVPKGTWTCPNCKSRSKKSKSENPNLQSPTLEQSIQQKLVPTLEQMSRQSVSNANTPQDQNVATRSMRIRETPKRFSETQISPIRKRISKTVENLPESQTTLIPSQSEATPIQNNAIETPQLHKVNEEPKQPEVTPKTSEIALNTLPITSDNALNITPVVSEPASSAPLIAPESAPVNLQVAPTLITPVIALNLAPVVNVDEILCKVCQSGENEDKLVLCDGCDGGYHIYCLRTKLESIPLGDWFCPACKRARRHLRKPLSVDIIAPTQQSVPISETTPSVTQENTTSTQIPQSSVSSIKE